MPSELCIFLVGTGDSGPPVRRHKRSTSGADAEFAEVGRVPTSGTGSNYQSAFARNSHGNGNVLMEKRTGDLKRTCKMLVRTDCCRARAAHLPS